MIRHLLGMTGALLFYISGVFVILLGSAYALGSLTLGQFAGSADLLLTIGVTGLAMWVLSKVRIKRVMSR